MSDIAGQESTPEYTEQAEPAPEAQEQDHSTGGQAEANPFWGEVEKLTGPNVYKLIQPHLAKADTEARKRVEAVNEQYAPWKAFVDQGIAPQHVQQALGVVHQLNSAPEQVFESLRSFLEREGRMPSQAELKQEVVEDEEEAQANTTDPQLEELQRKYEELQGFVTQQFTSQQQAQAAQEADSWLEGEVSRITQKGGYDEADIQEIIRIAAFQSQQTGQDPESLDAAASQFDAMRERIRTAPRPGASAPRLPMGPGGGSPQPQADSNNLTKQSRQELVAAMLQRGK